MNEDMGGKLREIIQDTKDKWFTCDGCGKSHQCINWHGYPHSNGVEDETGEKWWIYIVCDESHYQWAFGKLKRD